MRNVLFSDQPVPFYDHKTVSLDHFNNKSLNNAVNIGN